MWNALDPSSLLTGVGGALSGAFARDIIAWMRGAKRDGAETSSLVSKALNDQIVSMATQTDRLITGYKARVDDLTAEVHSLREEIVSLRQTLDASRIEMRATNCIKRGGCKEFIPVET